MKTNLQRRENIIEAGKVAIEQLIKVAEANIFLETQIGEEKKEYSPVEVDKLKNAGAAKKMAIFDAFEILEKIQEQETVVKESKEGEEQHFRGSPEKRAEKTGVKKEGRF